MEASIQIIKLYNQLINENIACNITIHMNILERMVEESINNPNIYTFIQLYKKEKELELPILSPIQQPTTSHFEHIKTSHIQSSLSKEQLTNSPNKTIE